MKHWLPASTCVCSKCTTQTYPHIDQRILQQDHAVFIEGCSTISSLALSTIALILNHHKMIASPRASQRNTDHPKFSAVVVLFCFVSVPIINSRERNHALSSGLVMKTEAWNSRVNTTKFTGLATDSRELNQRVSYCTVKTSQKTQWFLPRLQHLAFFREGFDGFIIHRTDSRNDFQVQVVSHLSLGQLRESFSTRWYQFTFV